MTQDKKKLLLIDLCARLPYRIKCEVIKYDSDGEMVFIRNGSGALELTVDNVKELVTNNLYKIKPYLFPLSSMTEEQSKIYHELIGGMFGTSALINFEALEDFFHKNHLDYKGLIPMGLAIDATNLNIY